MQLVLAITLTFPQLDGTKLQLQRPHLRVSRSSYTGQWKRRLSAGAQHWSPLTLPAHSTPWPYMGPKLYTQNLATRTGEAGVVSCGTPGLC